MSRIGATVLGIIVLAGLSSVRSRAQAVGPFGKADLGNPARVEVGTKYETATGTGVLVFHVYDEKAGALLHGHVQLQLMNLASGFGLLQKIDGDQDGIFPNLAYGSYEIEVSALGYLSVHQTVQVLATAETRPTEIVMHRDPAAVSLEFQDNVISAKARKEAKHAVSLIKLGDLPQAEKHLEAAYGLAPLSPDVNFLFGYLYFQKKDYGQAGTYLSTAVNLSPHNSRALTLLGRTELSQQNYPAAKSTLEQAIEADEDNWLPHSLLADAYLHQKEFGKARDEAQVALQKGEKTGKNEAGPAQVVLGQALISMGEVQEGIQTLETFIKDSPQNPLVYQIRALIAELEKKKASATPDTGGSSSDTIAGRANALDAVPEPSVTTQAWRPPDIDDVKPTLTAGVPCDTSMVVAESGKRVLGLVQDLSRFAADEDLFHQALDPFGLPTRTETRKYGYVAVVTPQPGMVSVDEYRSDKLAQGGDPDAIASTGFITLAFVFHPDMQKDFDFECEGQGLWRGQPSWIVHFRQRSDRPNRMHTYKVGQVFPVDLKGRAWITGDNFQIAQIEADMVRPVPQIQLLSEHQNVEYGPVPFPKKNTTLWLPKKAEIYFDFRKHHYYRRHSFDHFMLFSVDTDEKRKEPAKPEASDEKNPS